MVRKDMHCGVVIQYQIGMRPEHGPSCMGNQNSSSSDCMKQCYTNFKLRNHIETHYIIGKGSCSHPVCKAEFPCSAKIPYVTLSHSSTSPCVVDKNAGERQKALKISVVISTDDAASMNHVRVEQVKG